MIIFLLRIIKIVLPPPPEKLNCTHPHECGESSIHDISTVKKSQPFEAKMSLMDLFLTNMQLFALQDVN